MIYVFQIELQLGQEMIEFLHYALTVLKLQLDVDIETDICKQ
jgi:hypothetical protein